MVSAVQAGSQAIVQSRIRAMSLLGHLLYIVEPWDSSDKFTVTTSLIESIAQIIFSYYIGCTFCIHIELWTTPQGLIAKL